MNFIVDYIICKNLGNFGDIQYSYAYIRKYVFIFTVLNIYSQLLYMICGSIECKKGQCYKQKPTTSQSEMYFIYY